MPERSAERENGQMAMLWAEKILIGERKMEQTPRLLSTQVRSLLIDAQWDGLRTEKNKGGKDGV